MKNKNIGKSKSGPPMVAYYENEAAVDAALKAAKTPDEVRKIAQDLETRMAPHHWIRMAWDYYGSMF
ncbi:hypothetical protein [Flavonifractor plautii]|uniref:hypothetical protein n=1 Tax=Flavonifractor plautii TaxID=292800 RepID=UPI001A9BD3A3|nr:hypothetical protein [Flavonifractor plautii]